ncbi:helix-turn-helix transcriptional regulator [Streptosporangium sp. NPDC002544]|uniref:helix-turn-helix domain-containing protein n=1 Tax=Streptosporangium sp. NPDC002544 TaxID=3154538 RepID=UPI003319AACE
MISAPEPGWVNALGFLDRLTPRELEVFLLLADGGSNQEIADRLIVSERTVRAHLAQIMSKLQFANRLQACMASYTHRLSRPGGEPTKHEYRHQ